MKKNSLLHLLLEIPARLSAWGSSGLVLPAVQFRDGMWASLAGLIIVVLTAKDLEFLGFGTIGFAFLALCMIYLESLAQMLETATLNVRHWNVKAKAWTSLMRRLDIPECEALSEICKEGLELDRAQKNAERRLTSNPFWLAARFLPMLLLSLPLMSKLENGFLIPLETPQSILLPAIIIMSAESILQITLFVRLFVRWKKSRIHVNILLVDLLFLLSAFYVRLMH